MKLNREARRIAEKKISLLVSVALKEGHNSRLSQRYSKLAKKIAMRYRIHNCYNIRQLYCKKCKTFIIPGFTSRIRIGRYRTPGIRITCLYCGHTYRKMLGKTKSENNDL